MATLIASAKLTNAFRVRVVDKNISAALTTTATLVAAIDNIGLTACDVTSSFVLANTMRYATKGAGTVSNDGYFVTGQSYTITTVGNTNWNTIAGTTGVTYAIGNQFVANNNGTIGSTGKASLASWTARSTLVCEFPTYLEIDIEALMFQGLPEGTDCVLNFEEGWQLEDRGRLLPSGAYEYGSNIQNAPSPEFPSFVTFRTPKFFRSAFSSVFSLPNLVLRVKQIQSAIASASTFTAVAIFNPGKFAALFAGVSQAVTIARKTVVTGSTLSSIVTTVVNNTRARLFDSNLVIQTNFIADFLICIEFNATPSAQSNINADAFKFKGSLPSNLQSLVQIITAPNATFRPRSQSNVITSTLSSLVLRIKQLSATGKQMAFSLTANVDNIQRVPRWRSSSSYTIASGSTHISQDYDYYRLNGTQIRRYTFGSLADSDATAVTVSDPEKQFDVGPGGFYVAAANVVDYGIMGSPQNAPLNITTPNVAVCKLTSTYFALYNPSTARIQIYDTSGQFQSRYDNAAVNISTPRNISIQVGNGYNLDIVSCSSGGFKHMKYNGTSYETTGITTGVATDFRKMHFTNDGLTLFIEGFNATAAYVMKRASLTSSFTTITTITDSYIAAGYGSFGFDRSGGEFVFINNRCYQWNGSNYVYIRDAVYNVSGFVFGSSARATHITGNTATNLTFS